MIQLTELEENRDEDRIVGSQVGLGAALLVLIYIILAVVCSPTLHCW